MMHKNTALESIQFQKTDLFNEITLCISAMREADKVYEKSFYDGKECKGLSAVIYKHTGIKIEFNDSGGGPSVSIPSLGQDIFKDFPTLKAYKDYYGDMYDIHSDIKNVMKVIGMDLIDGTVNLKKSKVTGVFNKIVCDMSLPGEYLVDTTFTNEELAAIILHELGHVFTSFEYLDRSVTTNQALSIMLKTMDGSVGFQNKKVIFSKIKNKINLDDETYEKVLGSTDKSFVSLVVLNQQIQECKSELGESVYDVVSCEYLADQFAARHGAGRYLVTGLDKIFTRDKDYSSTSYMGATIMGTLVALGTVFIGGPIIGTLLGGVFGILTALVFGAPPAIQESKLDVEFNYDNDYTRLSRIKHQMVQRMKDPKTPKQEKMFILNYLEDVEPIIKKYAGDNTIKFRNRLAFFFNKKHKYDFEFMGLQKDLESLGNSNLFVMSEKLKALQS